METKMITIPFDVDLAKKIQAGEHAGKIITRGGKDVKILCFDAKCNLPIISLVKENETLESLQSYTSDRGYYGGGDISDYDLVLQVPEWAQYKEGDVVACEVDNGGGDYCKWLSILQGKVDFIVDNIGYSSYVTYDYLSKDAGKLTYDDYPDNIDSIRLATEEEKEKFIKRLKEEGTPQAKEYLARFFGINETLKHEIPNINDYTTIKTYEDACKVLGIEPILNQIGYDFSSDKEHLIYLPPHIVALMKLEVISRALWGITWNPVPNLKNSQLLFTPIFNIYTQEEVDDLETKFQENVIPIEGNIWFGCGYCDTNSFYTPPEYGYRLCQENPEKAEYFGIQFKELWLQYLRFNFSRIKTVW